MCALHASRVIVKGVKMEVHQNRNKLMPKTTPLQEELGNEQTGTDGQGAAEAQAAGGTGSIRKAAGRGGRGGGTVLAGGGRGSGGGGRLGRGGQEGRRGGRLGRRGLVLALGLLSRLGRLGRLGGLGGVRLVIGRLGGLDARGGGRRLVIVAGTVALDDLDGLPVAGLVTVDVLLDALRGGARATGVVDDGDALVDGVEGSVVHVGGALGPLDGTLGLALAATAPGAHLDLHGGLGELGGANLLVGQDAHDLVVDVPGDGLGGVLHRVLVDRGHGVGDGVESTTVEDGVVALVEVVGLDLGVITANPLEVDLVKVVRLEDQAGDDTATGGSLELDIDTAEEDVLVGGDGRGVGGLLDAEDGATLIVLELGAVQLEEGVARSLGQVAADLLVTEGRVGGAGFREVMSVSRLPLFFCSRRWALTLLKGLAEGVGLGRGHRGGRTGQESRLGEHCCWSFLRNGKFEINRLV
jgi:hypothetical protein